MNKSIALCLALVALTPCATLAAGEPLSDPELSLVYAQGGDPREALEQNPAAAASASMDAVRALQLDGVSRAIGRAVWQVEDLVERHRSRQLTIQATMSGPVRQL